MGAYDNIGPFTMVAGEALALDRIVLTLASTAKYADGGEEGIGITKDAVASGVNVSIQPMTGGIQTVTASKAIATSTAIYITTDGKVSDAAVGKQIGISMSAAVADGGKIPAIVWGPQAGQGVFLSSGTMHEFVEEFHVFDGTATVGLWNDAVTDGGTIAAIDGAGGVMSVEADNTDNNESYISTQFQNWLFSTTKPLFFEAIVKLTEANVDDANIIVGLSDTVAANSLQDNGAGPMASFDGVVFFKVDGGTVWQLMTSNAAGQASNTDIGAFTSAAWTKLAFFYDPNDGVTAIVTPFIDGVADTAVNLTIAGLAEMNILLGVKVGDTNAEALLIDRVHIITER